jgi:hypothetical protein
MEAGFLLLSGLRSFVQLHWRRTLVRYYFNGLLSMRRYICWYKCLHSFCKYLYPFKVAQIQTLGAIKLTKMKEILRENILKDEKKLWEEALFVFDSSALLNFYEYSEKTRQEIFSTAFEKLTGKLWITNQTEFEYLKNRDRVLLKPKKLYDDLITTHFDFKQFESFKNQFNQLQNRTKKDDKHPHFEEKLFQSLQTQIQLFENELQKFEAEIKELIETKKKEIDSTKDNDTLKTAVYKYFQITESYSFDELIKIAKEGEFRYKNQIPPGYEDLKEKIGLAAYGDLFIWKQILDLAKKQSKPIVLIIDKIKILPIHQGKNLSKNLQTLLNSLFGYTAPLNFFKSLRSIWQQRLQKK